MAKTKNGDPPKKRKPCMTTERLQCFVRFIAFCAAACMIATGVLFLLRLQIHIFIIGVYLAVFGLAALTVEIKAPGLALRWAPFLFNYLGKCFFFIFCGSIMIFEGYIPNILGFVTIGCGALIGLLWMCVPQDPNTLPTHT